MLHCFDRSVINSSLRFSSRYNTFLYLFKNRVSNKILKNKRQRGIIRYSNWSKENVEIFRNETYGIRRRIRIIIHFWFAAGGRFEVDERSGVVRTRGTDLFQLDMEYVLYVKAEDQNGRIDERRYQSTPEERLSIVGGKRAPQFYMTAYEAEIPENQKKDSEWVVASPLLSDRAD